MLNEKIKNHPLRIITFESSVEYIYDRERIIPNVKAVQSTDEQLTALKARLIVEDIPCLKCSTPMVLGMAIVPAKLINCLKCPACGYSETITHTLPYGSVRVYFDSAVC